MTIQTIFGAMKARNYNQGIVTHSNRRVLRTSDLMTGEQLFPVVIIKQEIIINVPVEAMTSDGGLKSTVRKRVQEELTLAQAMELYVKYGVEMEVR